MGAALSTMQTANAPPRAGAFYAPIDMASVRVRHFIIERWPTPNMPPAASAPTGIARLPNLGPKLAAVLAQVGVNTLPDLQRLGAVPAYLRAKAAAPDVSLNLLYALVGALDGSDWREVKRTQRLELLMQVESAGPARPPRDELLALRNIGPAARRDLELLGISTVAQLARQTPDRLYARLQKITGQRQDPCVWDTFAAAIHQAKTGEALPWWHFSAIRKGKK